MDIISINGQVPVVNGSAIGASLNGCMQEDWIASMYYKYYRTTFPENTVLNLTLLNLYSLTFERAFYLSQGLKKLTITTSFKPTSLVNFFNINDIVSSNKTIEEIVLNFNTQDVAGFNAAFYGCGHQNSPVNNFKILGVPLDFTSCTSTTSCFSNCAKLTEIYFNKNTIPINVNFGACYSLINDSLVSIANGLNESVANQILTLHATPKARLSTIMGTVALDQTNTYHIFTQDASGTTSLADFVTNVKGWTIA